MLAGLIRGLRESGTAVLVIDHNLDFVADVADRGYVLELGQVVYVGDVPGCGKQVEWPRGRPWRQRAVEVGPVSESLLSVRDVTSGYGSLMVLHGMTFDILPGEAVGIVGPNGAGKSTLLKTIAGALPTGRGSIALAGTSIERTSAARRVGHGIAPSQKDARLSGT